ncbi:hypothetical protein LSAT2_030080, partial [Lamellibrachia satsuma]
KHGKASFHKREKWQQQYNQHTRPLKEMHRGQSVRVQDHVKKKWESAIVKQKVGEPRSYIVTTKSGAEYHRNRRHIRTTGDSQLDATMTRTQAENTKQLIQLNRLLVKNRAREAN